MLGDPGFVTKKLVSKIYLDNGIEERRIGTSLTIKDVLEICTLNMLVKNGMVSNEDANECNLIKSGGL